MIREVPHARAAWLDPMTGAPVHQGELLRGLAAKRAVLLGETHDVAEIHRWQLQVTTCLHLLQPRLAVGFEMFPRRLQGVLDAWVDGAFTTQDFLEACEWRSVWGFDPELYLPLLHFCRQQRVPMIALNCRRALVTEVGRDGWDGIPEAERDGLTPSSPAQPAYREWLFGLVDGKRIGGGASAADPGFDRFVRAQQAWDRAFACNIERALAEDRARLVVGIIGRGHLEYGYGTPFQLADLGVNDVAVLLPNEEPTLRVQPDRKRADAIFRLDRPEPPSSLRSTPPGRISA